jgi:hemoglobin
MSSLYERLGGSHGIRAIAKDLVALHRSNPRIAPRFAASDVAKVEYAAATFFITGSGGPAVYQGKDMRSAHRGMNIDAAEFLAVLDDALEALSRNGIGQREREEVLFILYGMKGDILHV